MTDLGFPVDSERATTDITRVRPSFVRTNNVAMIKKLSAVGNSLGLIIERPILELLGITRDTPLEIKTDGVGLTIRPAAKCSELERVVSAADELMAAHDDTFRKLAQ